MICDNVIFKQFEKVQTHSLFEKVLALYNGKLSYCDHLVIFSVRLFTKVITLP